MCTLCRETQAVIRDILPAFRLRVEFRMFKGPTRVAVPRSCSGFQSLLFTLLWVCLGFLLIFSGAELPKLRGGRLLPSLSGGCREISGRNTLICYCLITLSVRCCFILLHSSEFYCFWRKRHSWNDVIIALLRKECLTDCAKGRSPSVELLTQDWLHGFMTGPFLLSISVFYF